MNYFCNRDNWVYKVCISILIFLHLFAFSNVKDVLAFNAQSESYKLSSGSVSEGGRSRASTYTKLLLHLDGADGSTNFIDEIGHTVLGNGNTKLDTSQYKFATASALFDGTDDYLSSPASTDWNFDGDFTIEAWVRIAAGNNYTIIKSVSNENWNNATAGDWLLAIGGDNKPTFYVKGKGTAGASGTALAANTWYHIAVVRSGVTTTLYVNGIADGGVISNSSVFGNTQTLQIGTVETALTASNFNGWLDEVRISKGIARWTSDFTPPQYPYGDSSVETGPTKLLSHFDGVDGAVSDTAVTGQAFTFLGNAQLDTADKKFGSSSLLLDGNGDYLAVADSNDFNFSSDSFTIDTWVNIAVSNPSVVNTIFSQDNGIDSEQLLFCEYNGHFILRQLGGPEPTIVILAENSCVAGAWQHIVLVRNENNWQIYVDGTLKASVTDTRILPDYTSTFKIGGINVGATVYSFNGSLDEFRISKGIARWTSNFTPPQAAYSDNLNETTTTAKLLSHFDGIDGAVSDTAVTGQTFTFNGNSHLATAEKKFGLSSLLLDGDDDYITLSDSDNWHFGSDNFTIDSWIYFNNITNYAENSIIGQYVDGDNWWSLYVYRWDNEYYLYFQVRENGESTINWSPSVILDTNKFYHIALVRNGNDLVLFQDGTAIDTLDVSGISIPNYGSPLYIGVGAWGGGYLNAYIDELRISKGTAEWTSNFTPPQEAYGVEASTDLTSTRLWQDVLGEPCVGKAQSASFILNSGYLATIQSNAPVLTSNIPYQNWAINTTKDNAFDLDDYFSSPEGYSLAFTVSGNSNIKVNIDEATHVVSFSQDEGYYGVEKIYFTATDTEGNSTQSNEVVLQVANASGQANKPVIISTDVSPTDIKEGDLATLTVKARDLDGQNLTFAYNDFFTETRSWQEGDYWFSESTWQTSAQSSGHYSVLVTVADPTSLTDNKSVLVNVGNVNHPPVLQPIPDITVNEGDIAIISPVASDEDNDSITFYFSSPFDVQGKWLTSYDTAGTYNVTVIASDGIDTVSQTAKIIVQKTNRAPQSTLTLSKYTVTPNEEISIVLSATDPDGDAMTFNIEKDGVEIASGNFDTSYTTTVSFSDVGDHEISGRVTDSESLTMLQTKGVDVAVANSAINPVMGDFNGDALTDLGLHDANAGKWEICLSDAGVFRNAVDWLSDFGGSAQWLPLSGDFNGDAKSDIAIYNYTSGELKVALSGGSGFSPAGTWLTVSSPTYQKQECRSYEVCSGFLWFEECEDVQECYNVTVYPWQPFTGNFNADKYTDFGLYNKETGEVKIALGNGSGFNELTTWLTGAGTDYIAMSGDFNGDSISDLCLFKKSSGEFKVIFSNTNSLLDESTWISGFAAGKDALVSDFNNDGLADIGYFDKTASKWYYAISTGKEFKDKGVWLELFGADSDESGTTGDFNGDGITDAACFDKDQIGIDRWTTRLSTNKPTDLLTEIDNSIGGKTQITYTYASQYDNDLLPFPVYVASSIALINTVNVPASYTQNFSYAGGYFDAAEREFRGFAKTTVTDPITGNYSETYFHQGKTGEEGALKGQIDKIIAYDGNGKLISESVNTYDVKKTESEGDVLGFPALVEQATTVYEENQTSLSTKNTFTYDNIGNVVITKNEGDITKEGDGREAGIIYSQAFQGFNRPIQSTLKDEDGNTITKKTAEYDDRGNLSQEVNYIYNPLTESSTQSTVSYSYDSFGNLISTIDALGRSVTTEYDTDFYSYPIRVTNVLGQTVTQTYNPKFGVVTSVTDTNGNTSQTFYDSLGRVTSAKNAYGETVTVYSYPDFNTKVTTNALGLSKTEYVDGLGRAYKAVSVGEDAAAPRQVSTEKYFNNRGQVEAESLPHYIDEDSSQISYVRYEYDIRGRVKKTISDFPGTLKDAEATISYINPLYIETTDPEGHKKGTLKDVYGNNIEITEFTQGGVYKTTYEYDIQNNLTTLTDSKGNITQIFYDSIGRKLKMIDPDMGAWFYEYDILGNLTKQTDAKNQTITFTYDDLNRLVNKVMDDNTGITSEVSYLYDDAAKENCIGRLSKVIDSSGSTEFFYDKLGREIESVKRVQGTGYRVQREYDILDRLTKLTYPDGEIVNYAYDANSGLLEKVYTVPSTLSPVSYVKDITYNAKGQIKNIAYGNNTQTEYTYGQDLRLSNIRTLSPDPSPLTLQDLNYIFDKNGNITTLTDNLKSNIRAYAYDELNRLTQASNVPAVGGGYTTFNYQYDSIGNMTYKSDVGVMTYGQNAGPHAVTTAGGYSYQYDANGNMIVGKNKTLTYDVENRLTSVDYGLSTENYTYDGDGGRVKKSIVNGQQSTETVYIGSLYETRTTNNETRIIKHIFAGSSKICTIEPEHTYYTHPDHLGSSSVITDETGAKIASYEYTPYGKVAQTTGSDITNYKFTGKELDSSGLYFYGARYYDPEIGRFITPDTIVQAPFNPQTLNRYSYCGNNPINYIDPTGHWFWFAVAAVFIGAASGAAISAITGGNIGAGAIMGAIAGAFFFAAGSAIGGLATALGIQKGTMAMTMLTSVMHTLTGAATGALGAVATGGDPGRSAFISGISAGISAAVAGIFPVSGEGFGAFVGEGLQRTTVGAILGGGASLVMGGSFGAGAAQGAMTSMISYVANESLHNDKITSKISQRFKQWFGRVFAGTRHGGGAGGSAKIQLGPIEAGIKMHDIMGSEVDRTGEWVPFQEEKHVLYGKAFEMKLNIVSYENGEYSWFKWVGTETVSSNSVISIGGTMPTPQTGGAAAINAELNIDLNEVFNF